MEKSGGNTRWVPWSREGRMRKHSVLTPIQTLSRLSLAISYNWKSFSPFDHYRYCSSRSRRKHTLESESHLHITHPRRFIVFFGHPPAIKSTRAFLPLPSTPPLATERTCQHNLSAPGPSYLLPRRWYNKTYLASAPLSSSQAERGQG